MTTYRRHPAVVAGFIIAASLFAVACQTTPGGLPAGASAPIDQVALLKKKQEEAAQKARTIMAAAAALADKGDARAAIDRYQDALAPATFSGDAPLKNEVLDRIAGLTGRLAAPPAIPDDARRHGIRGETLLQGAKDAATFRRAAKEFEAAVDAAPWWSSAYYNLALAREGALNAAGAITAYRQFLGAEPRAQEAPTIRDRMIALEVVAEEQARKDAWNGYWRSSSGSLLRSELKNNVLTLLEVEVSEAAKKNGYHNGQVVFSGALAGDSVTGKEFLPQCFDGAHWACKRCFPGFSQKNASVRLSGMDKIIITYDDDFMDRFNTNNCAILATKRLKGEHVYTRDKEAGRYRAGS